MITLIVAASDNNAIGKNNQLLWHLPADMKFFKNTTWAMPVIMGRKTFESMGKPLMGRFNIVITGQEKWQANGVKVAANLKEAIAAAGIMQTNEVFVIGGGRVYQESLPLANRIHLTRVHTILEGDTFFPAIDPAQWKMITCRHFTKNGRNNFDYSFETWERI